ncbi:MAG: hypothetical protein U9Q74_06380 [Gemmatimonadota bacterium]|nr:hypothetical protein [Gemmatimonadota bacterium]
MFGLGLLEMALFVGAMLIPIVLGVVLGTRAVRAYENRGYDSREVRALNERIERLERTIEDMGTEMERLAEQQRFTTRLLTEKGEGGG